MSSEVKGKLIQTLPIQSGVSKAGKEWSKQEFVIETTEDQFPKKICFTLFGDKVSILNGISVGDEIDVAYNVESRDFNGKWYHNINAWKISPLKQENNSSSYQGNNAPPPPEPNFENEGPAYDDLPF